MTVATYTPGPRLDAVTAPAVEKDLMGLFGADVASLDIDFAPVEYVSSAGLRVLLVAAKLAKARGGSVTLRAPRPAVLEVIRISGFDRILSIK